MVDDEPNNFNDLHCRSVAAQSKTKQPQESQFFTHSRNSPCLILSENLLSNLKAQGPPHMKNRKRKRNYKSVYIVFKRRGLWHDPAYLQRKETLRHYIKDLSGNYALL